MFIDFIFLIKCVEDKIMIRSYISLAKQYINIVSHCDIIYYAFVTLYLSFIMQLLIHALEMHLSLYRNHNRSNPIQNQLFFIKELKKSQSFFPG